MAKRKGYNFYSVILTLFVFLVPVLGSGFEKRAVVYASLFASLAALCSIWFKKGRIIVTKTTVFLLAVTVYAFLQISWVSDKGSQFAFASVFLLSAVMSIIANEFKWESAGNFKNAAYQTAYVSSCIYASVAVLHQIFIKSSFLGSNMDIGGGSPTAAGLLMIGGIIAAVNLFPYKRKNITYFIALAMMIYVFIMSRSLVCYLIAAILLLMLTLKQRHKKVEAFAALVLVIVLAVFNFMYIIAISVTGNMNTGGLLKGLVSIFGIGCNGYNSWGGILGKASSVNPQSVSLFIEAGGIFGVITAITMITGAFFAYRRKSSLKNLFMLMAMVAVLFTSSASLCFMAPLMAIYYSVGDDGIGIKFSRMAGFLLMVPASMYLMFSLAYFPYALGKNAADVGEYDKAAEYYQIGSELELFSSDGWYKAYKCADKAFLNGSKNTSVQKEYIANAIKFNKKNFNYKKCLAKVYANEKNYMEAKNVWDNIMLYYEQEYLYPEYAQRVYDVMANCPVGYTQMGSLYDTILKYSEKCVDKDIKLAVNNILAKSQKYYIDAREGTDSADMYIDDNIYEESTLIGTESVTEEEI